MQLNESVDVTFETHVPSKFLRPFVTMQEQYATLHEQLVEAEQATQKDVVPSGKHAPVPKELRTQLQSVREQLLKSELWLHSFFYRLDPAGSGAPAAHSTTLATVKADPWHVHTSVRIITRRMVAKNHTRNLLSGELDDAQTKTAPATIVIQTEVNGSTIAASSQSTPSSPAPVGPPRMQLLHFFRPRVHFHFMSDDISFPASRVPADIRPMFPKLRDPAAKRVAYAPLIATQELLMLRRDWRVINGSWIGEVERAEQTQGLGAAAAVPTTPANGSQPAVFTTNSTTQHGESDEGVAEIAAAQAATVAPEVPASAPYSSQGVSLTISLKSTSLGWFRLQHQMEHSMRMLADLQNQFNVDVVGASTRSKEEHSLHTLRTHGGMEHDQGAESVEDMKSMFIDSNPWLLCLTLTVSIVHMVLDMLAFKNDVSFWRERKDDFVGISARGVVINTVVRGIIFLYLVDQDASNLVLFSAALSLAINAWKSVKVMRISVGLSGSFPYILRFGPRPVREAATSQHDVTALRWMGLASLPFVVGASIWSLLYHSHKSWYSWVLGSCATAMYTGGFVLMTPQLFLNYKLKSVAHMPWRVFVYRACNTFIDDLFAFMISMPLAHRLACFRDDAVFLVYMYQRWIYPVDVTRNQPPVEQPAAALPASEDSRAAEAETRVDAADQQQVQQTPADAADESSAQVVEAQEKDTAVLTQRLHTRASASAATSSSQ